MREESGAAVRRRLSKGERRALILEAAGRVFADRGYEGASLDEIAEAAGISKPVIYDHFASKKALQISLLEAHADQMLSFMAARVGSGSTPEEQLAGGLDAFFEYVETHPYHWRLVFRDPTAADPDISTAHDGAYRRVAEGIAALIGSGPAGGRLGDPLDPGPTAEVVARLLIKGCDAVVAWWYEHREVPRQTLVELLMDVLWVGLEGMQGGVRWRGSGAADDAPPHR